jgi:hypothetical protein
VECRRLVLSLLSATASACDAPALKKTLDETSPARIGAAWVALADCDQKTALAQLPATLAKMIPGDEGNAAAERAIALGQGAQIQAWLAKQDSGAKSATVSWLGARCEATEQVSTFFLDAHKSLGDAFWKDRWYRGLADCRTPAIQEVLGAQVSSFTGGRITDKTQLLSLLEVYARNLRAASIPTLTALGRSMTDAELQSYVINAFADAANVGSTSGVDAAGSAAAVAAINELAPTLSDRALLQARTTLLSLEDDAAADRLARYRWDDRWSDGYTYAVAAVDVATCSNGKLQGTLHTARIKEQGAAWPEQIEAALRDRLVPAWSIDSGSKCKGTSEVTFTFPTEPFADAAAADAWIAEQVKAFDASAGSWSKATKATHPDYAW